MQAAQSPRYARIELLHDMATFWFYSKVLLGNSSLGSVPQQDTQDGEIASSTSKPPQLTAEELDIVWEIIKSMLNIIKTQLNEFPDASQAGTVYPCLGLESLNRLATEHMTYYKIDGQLLLDCSIQLIQLTKDVFGLNGGEARALDANTVAGFVIRASEIAQKFEQPSPESEDIATERLIAIFRPWIQKVKEADDRTVALESILSLEDASLCGAPELELVLIALIGAIFSCMQYCGVRGDRSYLIHFYSNITNLRKSQASSDLQRLHDWVETGVTRVLTHPMSKEEEGNGEKDDCRHEQ